MYRGTRALPQFRWCCVLTLVVAASPTRLALLAEDSGGCSEPVLHLEKGRSLSARKLYPPAIRELRAALDLCPGREDAGLELARAYVAARMFPEAGRTAQDLLKRNPSSEPAQL